MPCNTINTFNLRLENADKELTKQAIAELTKTNAIWRGAYVTSDGQVIIRSSSYGFDATKHTAELKRMYSKMVIQSAALAGNWTVMQVQSEQPNQLKLSVSRNASSMSGGVSGGGMRGSM
jgi:hypothetical protein